MLVVRTCQTYFQREELDSPPPTNPHVMVLTVAPVLVGVVEPRSTTMLKKVTDAVDE